MIIFFGVQGITKPKHFRTKPMIKYQSDIYKISLFYMETSYKIRQQKPQDWFALFI